jgi:PHP family Zn ribbon phosphoesterase
MNRVDELADRRAGRRPKGAAAFRSLIPLGEVLSEILGVGPGTKKVARALDKLVTNTGPELYILEQVPIEDIRKTDIPLLAEAIKRMRAGRVIREAGFDGEYGRIRLFEDGEIDREK